MSRMTLALAALLGCCAGAARADTLPSYVGISNTSTYTPGTSFSFELLVPQLGDFANYTVELIFHTQFPNPALTVSATPAPVGSYVFPSNANFHLVAGSDSNPNDVDLAFSDSTPAPGVLTNPGANDTLATITVTPDASFSGPITISLGAETSFSYDLELGSFPQPKSITITEASGGTPVPAPSSVVLLGIGGLLLLGRGRLLNRRPTVQNAC